MISAKNINDLRERKEYYYSKIDPDDKNYLTHASDKIQYPAARCDMGNQMYGHNNSASVKSMNAANKSVHEQTSVDLVSATIFLLQLEKKCFDNQKDKAWEVDTIGY